MTKNVFFDSMRRSLKVCCGLQIETSQPDIRASNLPDPQAVPTSNLMKPILRAGPRDDPAPHFFGGAALGTELCVGFGHVLWR
jgi:hypothetical protein